jgi:hypothetical protein
MRKSFSGAAAATTLTAPMGTTDTTATVGATTNWPNTATGPFVITIDRGTPSEEKVLVSAYTSTGLTVASGGRGYDGTTALAHAAGAAVVCTLDAVTIDEANAFVNAIGTVTPTTSAVGDAAADGTSTVPAASDHRHGRESFAAGATTTETFGAAASDGVSASPARADHTHGMPATPSSLASVAGRMYATAQTVLASGVPAPVTSMTQDFAFGGVTLASNALSAPVTGIYTVAAQVMFQNNSGGINASGQLECAITVNGSAVRDAFTSGVSGQEPSVSVCDLIVLTAGDAVGLVAAQSTGQSQATQPGSGSTWLSLMLVGTS